MAPRFPLALFTLRRSACAAVLAFLIPSSGMLAAETGPIPTWEVSAAEGRPLHREILGMTWIYYLRTPVKSPVASMRGVAGGLSADTYDWKLLTGENAQDTRTTLDFLRACRDNGWTPLLTANIRGVVGEDRSRYADMSPETLARLAGDWVAYCNVILPRYREGDEIDDPEARRILDSITWSPKLLPRGEPATPKVTYWELGNEPAVGAARTPEGAHYSMQSHPEDFVRNYEAMAAAMKAADPTIKVGPAFAGGEVKEPLDARPHVRALFRSKAPMDFVSYHGYSYIHQMWPNASGIAGVLRGDARKTFAETAHNALVEKLVECGRDPATIEYMVSEYNPASWGDNNAQASMGRALGTAANLFAFVERGYVMATTWDVITYRGVKWPVFLLFERLHRDLGDAYLGHYLDEGFSVYATRLGDRVMLWALNLEDNQEKALTVRFAGSPELTGATASRLHNPAGATSVLDRNTAAEPNRIVWSPEQPLPITSGAITLRVKPLEFLAVVVEGKFPPLKLVKPTAATVTARATPEPTPASPQAERPAAPGDLTAQVDGRDIRLQWSGERPKGGEFVIERSVDGLEFPTLAVVPASQQQYVDRLPPPGATLKYRIYARVGEAVSRYGNQVDITAPGSAGVGTPAAAATRRHPTPMAAILSLPLTDTRRIKLVGEGARTSAANGLTLEAGSYAVLDPAPIVPVGPGYEATFAIWVKTDRPGTIFSKNETHASPASHEYALLAEKWGFRWMSAVYIRNYKSDIPATDAKITDDKWHHVALVFRDNTIAFYVNGSPRGRYEKLDWNIPLNQPLLFGARTTGLPGVIYANFQGSMKNFEIYRRALPESEIKRLAARR